MMVFPVWEVIYLNLGSSKFAFSELPLLHLAGVIVENRNRNVRHLEACSPGPLAETLC